MASKIRRPRSKNSEIIKSKRDPFKEAAYEESDAYVPGEGKIRTTVDLIKRLRESGDEIDATVLAISKDGKNYNRVKMNKATFTEKWKAGDKRAWSFREFGSFDNDTEDSNSGCGKIGDDYVPLLGGPFYKQLYQYDYLRMHSLAFHAYHHDPIAHRLVHLLRDMVLGRGFRVDCKNTKGLLLWRAFEEANDLETLVDQMVIELSVCGELLLWELPYPQSRIVYKLGPDQKVPEAVLPRFRLIDPSVIWEIVTYPEDITRVLYYQWVAQTQYQIYTGSDQGNAVPGSKWIFQQIPASEVTHFKVNSFSNEKRGRSDLFPILGYLKRLRDSVNYSIVSLQKNSAWSIDTTIEGNQPDLDAYIAAQQSLGEYPPAGSEFVHTKKIERKYLGNDSKSGGSGHGSPFDWCLDMICIGFGVPVSYMGGASASAHTRASAAIGTEPVTKMLQKRQQIVENILKKMAAKLFQRFDLTASIEVTFPEIIVQDRSVKLRDTFLAANEDAISHRRASEIAAKELGITEYDYHTEQKEIMAQPGGLAPLTAQPIVPGAVSDPSSTVAPQPKPVSGVTSDAKRAISMQR